MTPDMFHRAHILNPKLGGDYHPDRENLFLSCLHTDLVFLLTPLYSAP